jgi:hypothetical protein
MWFAGDDPRAPTGWHVRADAQRITPTLSTAARAPGAARSTALSRGRGARRVARIGAAQVVGTLSSPTGRP